MVSYAQSPLTMRTIITLLAFIAIPALSQCQTRAFELDSMRFEIVTQEYPDGRGYKWDNESLYFLSKNGRTRLPLTNKWKEAILIIGDIKMSGPDSTSSVKVLEVKYFCQLGAMQETFFFLNGEWISDQFMHGREERQQIPVISYNGKEAKVTATGQSAPNRRGYSTDGTVVNDRPVIIPRRRTP